MARVYACLDEKEQAVEQLRLARKQGRLFFWDNYYWDLFLVNLKGYGPFEEFLKEKG